MYKEASEVLTFFDRKQLAAPQLVIQHMQWRNAAEKSILTWNNHFIAGLCGVVISPPMHLSFCLLKQAQITLNLLKTAISNPKLSAQVAL